MTQYEEDLRSTAAHEAGHLVVSRHFGVDGKITLFDNPGAGYGKLAVLGYFQHDEDTPFNDPRGLICMSLAGRIAGCLYYGLGDAVQSSAGVAWDCLDDWLDDVGWSKSDEAGAEGWDAKDFRRTFDILVAAWPSVLAEADRAALAHCPSTQASSRRSLLHPAIPGLPTGAAPVKGEEESACPF